MRLSDPRIRLLFFCVLPALIVGTFYSPNEARSFPIYPPLIPNRTNAVGSDGSSKACITCHNNPDGGLGCVAGGGASPCLNAFGDAFRANGKLWNATLAVADSDGDGFTNGQELQDPNGSWVLGQSSPGVSAYVTRPGADDSSPGHTDADRDGYCWFGVDTNADGDCLDAGEDTDAFDCNDSDGTIRPGATEVCSNAIDNDCDGLPTLTDPDCANVVDRDGDGYCPMGRDLDGDRNCADAGENDGSIDCGPDNVLVNPGAYESCIDGVDNDCDGDVDTADSQCNGDADADDDGYCPVGQDLNNNGNCNDAGESTLPSDCDDRSASISPGDVEVCGDGADNDCDGDPDFDDVDCEDFKDADGDGWCPKGFDANRDGDCVDTAAGDRTNATEDFDCNDADAFVHQGAEEICTDAIDQDCDGDPDYVNDLDCAGFKDADGDGYCPAGGFDANRDGDCADNADMTPLADCDDIRASVNPLATENCFNGIDDDCDGSTDAAGGLGDPSCVAYADRDRDGYCAQGRDSNGDFDCTDAGEQDGSVDAAPIDPTVSPGNGESCFDLRDNDQDGAIDAADSDCTAVDGDGDGYCPMGKDVNGDGDCMDAGENFRASDCRDDDAAFGPHTGESFDASLPLDQQRCFDLKDNDCDGKVDLADPDCGYLFDRDGDRVCGHGVDDNSDGDCLDNDEQRFGEDCADADPLRASTRPEICTNGFDDDCDGNIDTRDTNCMCQSDTQCSGGDACHIPRCISNVCALVLNSDCADGGRGGGGGGCGVRGGDSQGGGLPFGAALLASLGAVVVRRVRARRRG